MFHGIYSEGEVREWGKFKPGGWLLVPAATSARIENLGEPEYSFESWDALVVTRLCSHEVNDRDC